MSKSLIIASESSNLYTTKRFLEEGKKLKWSSKWLNPYESSLEAMSFSPKTNLYLIRTTGIRYDDFDLTCAKHFSLFNFKVANSIDAARFFRSKENQALFFKEHEINSIENFIYRGKLNEEILNQITLLSPSSQFILKMSRGNQGIGVNLINGTQSLTSLLETFHAIRDQRFLLQPYIPHKKELRIFIIKKEVHAIIEKTIKSDDFRGNAKRSTAKLITKLPTSLQSEIERIIALSKLDYCGIDFLYDEKNKEFKILEINPVPGFEQVETLSNKNIAKEILTSL